MLTVSIKTTRKKLLGTACVVLSLIIALILFFGAERPGKAAEAVSLHASDNKARISYLASKGLETATEPSLIKDIAIPYEFDEVLLEYNEIIKTSGFDLLPYSGKTVRKYEYLISGKEETYAVLYVFEDKIIAADISSNIEGKKHPIDAGRDLG